MKTELIYWRGSAEVRADLLGAFAARSFEIVNVRTFEQILDYLTKKTPVLLIVDGSAGEREGSDRVVELSTTQALYGVTTVFVSPQASKRTLALKSRFRSIIPIDIPYQVSDVLTQVSAALSMELPTPEDLTPPRRVADEVDPKPSDNKRPRNVEDEAETVARDVRRRALVTSLQNPTQLGKSNGGTFFALARQREDFDDSLLMPAHHNSVELERAVSELSKVEWLAAHLRRTTYAVAALASKLGLDAERERALRCASLLLNWGMRQSTLDTLMHDFVREPTAAFRDDFGKAIHDSSEYCRTGLRDERASGICAAASGLCLGTGAGASPAILQDASCALLIEIAARTCWKEGLWNHYGAYRVLRFIYEDRTFNVDRATVPPIIKMLGEAVCARPSIVNFVPSGNADFAPPPRPPRLKLSQDKQHVELAHLTPGMKLAEPVRTIDGKLILDARVKLDESLVFHLWQLAAVRSLVSPIAIERIK